MDFEDIVQDICVSLEDKDYKRLRSFQQKSSPETWLFSLVKHDMGKRFRKQSKMVGLEDLLPDSFLSPPGQEQRLLTEERMQLLLEARSKLTPGEKTLFDLVLEDKSDPEIAEALKIKIKSVWSRKSRLIKKIRETLR